MNFYDLIHHLIHDTLGTSLTAFRPELTICATIVALLLVRMLDGGRRIEAFYVMAIGSAAALYFAAPWHYLQANAQSSMGPIFTGMLVFDPFSVYMRGLLLFFALLFATFTRSSGVPDRNDATEFYVLILGATLGMCLMVSANHMLIVFLGVEMASVPSYALAGLLRHRRQSSEAALKFAVFGAGTAGVMLYGISLLVGVLGSAHLPTMASQSAHVLAGGAGGERLMVLALGGLMVMVGLAFKLSAVPFHFWAPDVFEGATAEVAAFLSIASKAAALALLIRLTLGLGYIDPGETVTLQVAESTAHTPSAVAERSRHTPCAVRPASLETESAATISQVSLTQDNAGSVRQVASNAANGTRSVPATLASPRRLSALKALKPARNFMAGLVALLAAITCTFGNLAAYGQTNIKRLLAYSTIAHAGYMMMAVPAAITLSDTNPAGARAAVAALAFYAGIYLFMNLGAFAAAAFLRNLLGSENIADYAGLIRRSPGVTICFAVVLFSLIGLPPLAGFAAKFTIFAVLFDARLLTLLAIGALNTVLSLFYYIRVVRVMVLSPEPEHRRAPGIPLWSPSGLYLLIITSPLVVLGIWWGGLFDWRLPPLAGCCSSWSKAFMKRTDPIEILNHLLRLLFRSLPVYLEGGQLWTGSGNRNGVEVLHRIASERRAMSQQLAAAIYRRGGLAEGGNFPAAFTGMHDLALDYVVKQVRSTIEQDVKTIQHFAAAVADDPEALLLVNQALAAASKHLEMLDTTTAKVAG